MLSGSQAFTDRGYRRFYDQLEYFKNLRAVEVNQPLRPPGALFNNLNSLWNKNQNDKIKLLYLSLFLFRIIFAILQEL